MTLSYDDMAKELTLERARGDRLRRELDAAKVDRDRMHDELCAVKDELLEAEGEKDRASDYDRGRADALEKVVGALLARIGGGE